MLSPKWPDCSREQGPVLLETPGVRRGALPFRQRSKVIRHTFLNPGGLYRLNNLSVSKRNRSFQPPPKRLETQPGLLAAQDRTIAELRRALEKAGVEFIAENGGGAGVRMKKRSGRR